MLYQPPEQACMLENAAGESRKAALPAISDLITMLRQARRELSIRQLDLAVRLGVTEITVVEWETHRDVPATGNFFRWAHELGCTVEIRESSSGELIKDANTSSVMRTVESRMRRISRMLKQIRIDGGLTQEALGEELDVSRWTVRMWESAQRTPRLVHLVEWCEALNCQLALAKV